MFQTLTYRITVVAITNQAQPVAPCCKALEYSKTCCMYGSTGQTTPPAASAADPTAGGRHVSTVAEGNDDVTELSRGTRGAKMIGDPAGTDADVNTVGRAAATGVGAINLALPSAMSSVNLCNYNSQL